MTIEELDRTLQRLRDSAQAISANLLELELDPHRRLLDESDLQGQSQRRWAQATATQAQLWQWYSLLDGLLDRATELRGTRGSLSASRLAELASLLVGPSIELEEHPVPIEQRQLLGGPVATLRCSPDELLQRMAVAFDQTKGEIAAFGRVWDGYLPRVQDLHRAQQRCREICLSLGEAEPAELERARRRLGTLSETLARDPLSLAVNEVDSLESSIETARRTLDQLAQTSRAMTDLLAQARVLLGQLQVAVRDGLEAHREVQLKIANPRVCSPLSLDDGREPQLARVAALAGQGAWRDAQRALDQWTAQTHAQLVQTEAVTAQNRAPVAARNELRGLLEAYQAKAHRLGLAEDSELAVLFDRARAALYTAPTDLERASALVRDYQRAVPAGAGTPRLQP